MTTDQGQIKLNPITKLTDSLRGRFWKDEEVNMRIDEMEDWIQKSRYSDFRTEAFHKELLGMMAARTKIQSRVFDIESVTETIPWIVGASGVLAYAKDAFSRQNAPYIIVSMALVVAFWSFLRSKHREWTSILTRFDVAKRMLFAAWDRFNAANPPHVIRAAP